jgi:hypothetical protein
VEEAGEGIYSLRFFYNKGQHEQDEQYFVETIRRCVWPFLDTSGGQTLKERHLTETLTC